jgi:predicted nuclease with TOPRIM domain
MTFIKEQTSYSKTALSDLQGAWSNLRGAVVDHFGFPNSDKLLFQIDEAMSWESVRNLHHMKEVFLVVKNISSQNDVPEDVTEWIEMVREDMEEVFSTIREGEKI